MSFTNWFGKKEKKQPRGKDFSPEYTVDLRKEKKPKDWRKEMEASMPPGVHLESLWAEEEENSNFMQLVLLGILAFFQIVTMIIVIFK